MTRSTTIAACLAALLLGALWPVAADAQGKQAAKAAPSEWLLRLGKAGAWKTTTVGAIAFETLFTVEAGGELWATDLATGERARRGVGFKGARFLFSLNQQLYCVDSSGTLGRVDAASGEFEAMGARGAWGKVSHLATLEEAVYSLGPGGVLYATRLDSLSGGPVTRSGGGFGDTRILINGFLELYDIDGTGKLWRLDTKNSARTVVGDPEAATPGRAPLAAAAFGMGVFSVNGKGKVEGQDIIGGQRVSLGTIRVGKRVRMFTSLMKEAVFIIDGQGNLLRLRAKEVTFPEPKLDLPAPAAGEGASVAGCGDGKVADGEQCDLNHPCTQEGHFCSPEDCRCYPPEHFGVPDPAKGK